MSTTRDINRLANEVFALPGTIAAARKRPVIVALDEFQAIEGFEKMIGPRRPFYKAGPIMRFQKMARSTT